jgi:zinc/manganese transport system permease protein
MFDIMLPAFIECLVLVGIHSYLGIHVIKRGVIFVDLALAQMAAFGTVVAFIFHYQPDSGMAFTFSLLAAVIGAFIFSILKQKKSEIPLEAGIGVTYAIFSAATILLIEKAPHGGEHIQAILTGSLLWVQWKTIITVVIVYSGVGIFHYIFRHKFIAISENSEKAENDGINVRLWDFLFYLSFGIVITLSVRTAGVLLVFVFLIAPSLFTMMIASGWKNRLIIAWIMGTLVSLSGLIISYKFDFPTGPSVIIVYGIVLLVTSIFKVLISKK